MPVTSCKNGDKQRTSTDALLDKNSRDVVIEYIAVQADVRTGASHFCKLVVGWRSLCVAQTSRSGRDRARERDAPTTVFFASLRCWLLGRS